VLDTGGHFIFVCKPSSHPLIEEYLTGIDLPMVEQPSSAASSASCTATAGCRT
jgi:hypothetical protein